MNLHQLMSKHHIEAERLPSNKLTMQNTHHLSSIDYLLGKNPRVFMGFLHLFRCFPQDPQDAWCFPWLLTHHTGFCQDQQHGRLLGACAWFLCTAVL